MLESISGYLSRKMLEHGYALTGAPRALGALLIAAQRLRAHGGVSKPSSRRTLSRRAWPV
jgi:hypothetical protein